MRVAVVGLGIAGASALYWLSKQGAQADGYDQFYPGSEQGSSHGSARIIRYSYPDPLYAGLMKEGYRLWRELESATDRQMIITTGGIYFGPADHPEIIATESALIECGADYEKLSHAADRFPLIKFYDGEAALYQPDMGYITEPGRCAEEIVRRSHARFQGDRVLRVDPDGSVHTRSSVTKYDAVIIAAGAWMNQFAPNLPVAPTAQQMVYFRPTLPISQFSPPNYPVWIDADTHYYGLPWNGKTQGIRVSAHIRGPQIDPDADRPDLNEETDRIRAYIDRRLSGLSDDVVFSSPCVYTNTPDEDFVLDFSPESKKIVYLSACSGHGFKFGPLMGKLAAEMALSGDRSIPPERFRLDRLLK
ncbi:MAG: FAD-dependent oxidoreductase [Armatimonadetes bacterium]|nr:FAD-dependent oxidoreductase [Armatimonadota bacterium]